MNAKDIKKNINYVKNNKVQILVRAVLSAIVVLTFLLVFFLFDGLTFFIPPTVVTESKDCDLEVNFIDIGQGDASLVRFPNDKLMLIDTGDSSESDSLVSYIDEYLSLHNLNKIDYLVLTHPDADHVGGTKALAENFEIEIAYRPKYFSASEEGLYQNDYKVSSSQTYDNAISSLYSNQVVINFSESGISFNEGGAEVEFLAPISESYSNTNNYSAVLKISYEGKSFLFTGDAESLVERELIASGADLDVDVLKVSHHGSSSGTSQEFLDLITPLYACISVGADNSYGHPDSDVLNRLTASGSEVYMTSASGSFAIGLTSGNLEVYFVSTSPIDFTIVIVVAGVLLILIWGIKLPKSKK